MSKIVSHVPNCQDTFHSFQMTIPSKKSKISTNYKNSVIGTDIALISNH